MPKLYQTKVIVSGHVVEVYRYQEPRARGLKSKPGAKLPTPRQYIDMETGEILSPEEVKLRNRQKNVQAQRNKVRRLALANFTRHDKFLTLTFQENIQDIEKANKCFKQFIQNMNRELARRDMPKLEYLAVIEFQKRGAIHYHMLCKLPYFRVEIIRDCWRRAIKVTGKTGNIDLKDIRHVDNVGAYIVKYMSKDMVDMRLAGKKAFWCSRGLKRPREYIGEDAERIIKELKLEHKKTAYQSKYLDKQTHGEVSYQEYNLERQG